MGLSEVELQKENIDISTLKVPNYELLLPKSWESTGNARVVVYVKKTLTYQRVEQLETANFQSIWFTASLKNTSKMYFCHGYREHLDTLANQKHHLNIFLSQWERALEFNNPSEKNEVHVSLDMNIDSLNGRWLESTYRLVSLGKLVQNCCDIGNFTQLVNEPTRMMFNSVTGTTEISCIDHVYTNAKNKCSKPTIKSFGSSDHDLVTYTRYSTNSPTNGFTVRKRSYKNFHPTNFIEDLKCQDWTQVLYCSDLEMAVTSFTVLFLQILDMHAPWIMFQNRKKLCLA